MGGPTKPADDAGVIRRSSTSKTPRQVTLASLGDEFAYLGDNDYIHKGYRADYTFMACIKSMFQAHNETMNVWTHLLGGLLFVAFTVHVLVDAYTSGVAATAGPTETPCDASLFVSSSPYLANGSHTAAMYQAAIATNLKHADSAFEWRELARGLSDKVTQAQQAVSDEASLQFLALSKVLKTMKDEIVSVEESVSADAALRVRAAVSRFAAATEELQDDLKNMAEAGISKADETLAELSALGDKVSDAIEHFAIEHLPDAGLPEKHLTKWPIVVFLLSGTACLLLSAAFHLFFVVDEEWFGFFARLDYTGIGTLIAGSTVPLVYYGFVCRPITLFLHLIGCFLACSVCVAINFLPKFRGPEYRPMRAGGFVLTGGYGAFPLGHMIYQNGLDEAHYSLLVSLLIMGGLYVFGAFLYANRIPERFSPGRFDYLLSSHQLFHMFVVAAAVYHYTTVMKYYNWRLGQPCTA